MVKYFVFGRQSSFDSASLGQAMEVAWTESAALGGASVDAYCYEDEKPGYVFATVQARNTA